MSKVDPHRHSAPAPIPGKYGDGHPLDEVEYFECKIILKPDRFTSVQSFLDFGKLVRRAAEECAVDLSTSRCAGQKPRIREVVFLDTGDFRLYNNAFILRRRITYVDGFPVGDPEFVFKFRHPDMQKAAELDVRPKIPGAYQIKFKAELLPLRDQIGGFRVLFSHNVEFSLSQVAEADRSSLVTLVRLFPCLAPLKNADTDTVELVNQTIVEEVLVELGTLDFGKGVVAKANATLWRSRGEHKPLVGEFSYQAKFDRRKAKQRSEQFFVALQKLAKDLVFLGMTKTGIVYRLKGNPPQSHE